MVAVPNPAGCAKFAEIFGPPALLRTTTLTMVRMGRFCLLTSDGHINDRCQAGSPVEEIR